MLELTCRLPMPPGINHTYRSTQDGKRWYKVTSARLWEEEATLYLRQAGFRPQPKGAYWLAFAVTFCAVRVDLDGPLKILIDTVAKALAIDDRTLGQLCVRKIRVRHYDEQAVEVHVRVLKAPTVADFNRLSRGAAIRTDRSTNLSRWFITLDGSGQGNREE